MRFLRMPRQIRLQMTRLAMTFLFVLIIAMLFMQILFAQTIDEIVAVVNDEVIAQSDVQRVLAAIEAEYRAVYTNLQELAQRLKQVKENIINQMVEEKLILSQAKKSGIKIEEDRIEARIEQIKKKFSSTKEFEQALEAEGITLKDLKDRFRDQEIMKVAVDYFVRSEIKVDPREIREFYQAQQDELHHPERAQVKSIFIKVDKPGDEYAALQRAKMILERLRKGEDFAQLAREYSQGVNAQEGGDLGMLEKGQLIKELDEAIFSLNPGEFSDVLKTPRGYRIFKVVDKQPKRALAFSEAQDAIKEILYRKKFTQAFKEWMEELKQNAYIMIKDE